MNDLESAPERTRGRGTSPPRRFRRTLVVAGAAVTAAAAVSAGFLLGIGTDDPAPSSTPSPPAPTAAPPGWRWESSLGAEALVPADWVNRDNGCVTRPGTIMRVGGFGSIISNCLEGAMTPDTPVVRFDLLGRGFERNLAALGVTLPPGRPTTVAGVPAERGEADVSGALSTGWVKVPSRGFQLTVQTPDPSAARRILDSLRLVDVDFNGCPTAPPAATSRPGPFAPTDAASLAVCFYGEGSSSGPAARLHASARLTGPDVAALAKAVNSDASLPAPAPHCGMEQPQSPSAALLFRDAAGAQTVLRTRSNDCRALLLTDGTREKAIPRPLAKQIFTRLHTAYGPDPELTN